MSGFLVPNPNLPSANEASKHTRMLWACLAFTPYFTGTWHLSVEDRIRSPFASGKCPVQDVENLTLATQMGGIDFGLRLDENGRRQRAGYEGTAAVSSIEGTVLRSVMAGVLRAGAKR